MVVQEHVAAALSERQRRGAPHGFARPAAGTDTTHGGPTLGDARGCVDC